MNTPTQLDAALIRIALRRDDSIVYGEEADFYSGLVSTNPDEWGIITWTEAKLGARPTMEELNSEVAAEPVVSKELSKLGMIRKLRGWAKEDAFFDALAGIPHAVRDFDAAQIIMSDDPMFVQHAAALKQMVGLTDEQFAELTT